MARYKDYDRTQGMFLTVDLGKQLVPGTFEWTVDHVVDRLDLSGFDTAYNNDETGAKAYPPAMLLKLLLYCYSRGINSSRRIEAACAENIVAKALAADAEPDHATIAHFISANADRFAEVFSQVTVYCGELGLIGGDMFAIDGCKLPSNASKELSGTLEDFRKKKADLEKPGKKLAKQRRERGTAISIGPWSVRSSLPVFPFRRFVAGLAARSCFSCPGCSVSSASMARSASALASCFIIPSGP